MPSNRPKWTDEHRSEARRRAYELAATLPAQKARTIALDAEWGAAGEQHYRRILREAGLDTGRIEREVRRRRRFVPVIVREFLPPREAGMKVGIVVTATIMGMAVGGLVSGAINDLFASYRLAFLNGLLWNLVNLAVVFWLMMKPRQGRAVAA